MFTGIIEATARVQKMSRGRLTIERPNALSDIRIGSSVSVAGVCLTIEKLNKKVIQFAVVPETIRRSTLGSCKKGDMVNLERAMKADGRFDGHVVQGHSEGVGVVARSREQGGGILTVRIPKPLLPNILPKGSIAIDGVSLTVASIEEDRITVALIPYTLENTTLGILKKGDRVNIETDILARYARKEK